MAAVKHSMDVQHKAHIGMTVVHTAAAAGTEHNDANTKPY